MKGRRDLVIDLIVMAILLVIGIAICLLLTGVYQAGGVKAAPEEPDLFGYIQPGCRYYYRAGGDNYYIENRGEAVINGLFYISYQVWYEISPGGLYDFLTVGLLSPQDTHAETVNIPLVGWLDHNHMYVSSSDPAKSYRWTGCPIYLPVAMAQ